VKIHHLNCMTFRRFTHLEVTHVLLLETQEGLILVDSGLGLGDFSQPGWAEWLALRLDGFAASPNESPIRQLAALGFNPREVRDIFPTHLHLDHIGGACDFPWAKVHIWDAELQAGLHPTGWLDYFGYFPARWKGHPGLTVYSLGKERWFGLAAIPILRRAEVEIWLVPLVGHTPGLCGVAIKSEKGWLWHCGDAYVRQTQVNPAKMGSAFPWIARQVENSMFPVGAREKIRDILTVHGDQVEAICSHDPELFRLAKKLG
jgi:glyoxylase-like metal-dependent hydrolase (beta-lactamase superfamily II)